MMDEFDALLGMDVADDERMRMMADSLRGRKRAADFFAITTIPQIASSAQAEQKNVLASAKEAGGLRRAMEDRKNRMDIAKLNNATRLKAAMIAAAARRSGQKGESTWGGLKTQKERSEFESKAKELSALEGLAGSYKDSFGPMLPIPGLGEVENFVGRYLPSTQNAEDQTKWWSQFEELFSLEKRHNFFGSAFTKTEQAAWNRAFFSPSVKPELMKRRLNAMVLGARLAAEHEALKAKATGVSDDLIHLSYGNMVDIEPLWDMYKNRPQEYQQRLSDMKAQIFSMLEAGEDEWTPELDAELQALEAAAKED